MSTEQDARLGLLRYYSFECVTRGTYILSLAVAFVAVGTFIFPYFSSLGLPSSIQDWLKWTILEGFLFAAIYFIGRTFWWGYLITGLLVVKPKTESEYGKLEEGTTLTLLRQIHDASAEYVSKSKRVGMRLAKHFSSFSVLKIMLVFYVNIVTVTLLYFLIVFGLGCP